MLSTSIILRTIIFPLLSKTFAKSYHIKVIYSRMVWQLCLSSLIYIVSFWGLIPECVDVLPNHAVFKSQEWQHTMIVLLGLKGRERGAREKENEKEENGAQERRDEWNSNGYMPERKTSVNSGKKNRELKMRERIWPTPYRFFCSWWCHCYYYSYDSVLWTLLRERDRDSDKHHTSSFAGDDVITLIITMMHIIIWLQCWYNYWERNCVGWKP